MSKRELNILFTCVGRRVALIDCFRRAMAELGLTGRCLATDITSTSPAFHKADKGFIAPSVNSVNYTPAVLEIAEKNRAGLLVPLTDLDLRVLARHRERYAKVGCTVMVASEPTIVLCRDKVKTFRMMRDGGLATIVTFSLEEFMERPFYPCFVKPVRGSGGFGASVVHTSKQMRAHIATFGEQLLVQEYVPGQEFTIDVYRTRDRQVRCVVPRQRLAVRSGEVEKGITVRDEPLVQAVIKLSGLLDDLWGVFCCQCRRGKDAVPHFFEINPRFGGGAPLTIAAGANLPLYLLQEILNLPVTAELGKFTENLLMLRYDEAAFVRVENPSSLPGYDTPLFR
jgi:carbamoyl-phosphate synthase large subunit